MKKSVGIRGVSWVTIVSNYFALGLFIKPDLAELVPSYIKYALYSLFPYTMLCLNFKWHICGIIFALFFIALGVFILRQNEMARKLFICFQVLFLIIGLASAIFALLWYGELTAQGMTTFEFIRSQLLPTVGLFAVFPAIFLFYFTRSKVKEQFIQ